MAIQAFPTEVGDRHADRCHLGVQNAHGALLRGDPNGANRIPETTTAAGSRGDPQSLPIPVPTGLVANMPAFNVADRGDGCPLSGGLPMQRQMPCWRGTMYVAGRPDCARRCLRLLDRHEWVSGTMVPRHCFGSTQLFIAWPPRTEPPDAYMTDDVGVPIFLAVRISARFFPPPAGVRPARLFLLVGVGPSLSEKFLLRIVMVLILFRSRLFLSRHFPVVLHAIVLHPALE